MIKLSGIVVKGRGGAGILGFPSANIELKKTIKNGVYAGAAKIGGKKRKYKTLIFIPRDRKILEAHLLGFNGNLYEREIFVSVGEKIREEMDFKNKKELKKQIKKDVENVYRHY